ncbi:MAG: methyl-accepting chemotaxis protein [Bryobacteraceae bacterium]|jgi:methyl-accepting chemotaxis protein
MARQVSDGRRGRPDRNASTGAAVLDSPAPHAQGTQTKNLLQEEILRLASALQQGQLAERARTDQFEGADRAVVDSLNGMLDSVIKPLNMSAECMDRISKGDIPPKITEDYTGDFNKVKNNLNVCIDAISMLVTDGVTLTKAMLDGKLAVRADAAKHQGDFRKVIEGFNVSLDNVIKPLNVTAEYMDRISKGDIPPKITDVYTGDFNEVKNNLNVCIDAISQVVTDGITLTKAMLDGKLAVRADAAKHQGDFRKVIEGFNVSLDNVIKPLNVTAEYMDRISKGDIPPKITDVYTGDFNEVKNNLNVCIDAISQVVTDGVTLTKAMLDGKLAVRADATKHQGDFRKVIEGFNVSLDNVIKPLNVTAEYMDRISKGDIPPKITDVYTGDFNEVKNNLNVCIDAISMLVTDGVTLTKAMLDGKLAVRADATKHQGDFRKVIEGFNVSLDNVIKPLNVTAEYMDRISKGVIPPKITEEYTGDFNAVKNNLNVCIDAISMLVTDGVTLTKAMLDGKLAVRADAAKHLGDFRKVIEGFNVSLDNVIKPLNVTAEYMDRISKGDIPPKITEDYTGDFNEVKNNLNVCIDAISQVVTDGITLTKAMLDGKLAVRADAAKHQGDFRKVIEGFNVSLDNVIKPLNVTAEYMDRISKGDIPPKITDVYTGDFNEVKNNLNVCIDAISMLVTDGVTLTRAMLDGKLAVRADAAKHQGDFRKVIEGFNVSLDNVIKPLNVTAEYMDRISKGDIPPKITDTYTGDFNEVKNNLNVCIDAISQVVTDGITLTKAMLDGKLAVRADAAKHQGDFRKVIEGFNVSLDNVIKPLNISAEYMDRISKGDIPPKITDTYTGDFNEVKNNLNVCIDAISQLVTDGITLTKAMLDGKLAVRADAAKHQGDFRKVIEGFNVSLDNVIKPLNVTAEYMDRISKGDIPPKITDTYTGDFNEVKNNLNVCIDAISQVVTDGITLTKAMLDGKLALRADATKHQGDFRKVIEGFNVSLDNVIKPLNVTSEYMDRISKGVIPPKITEDYTGDFNAVKNNLNIVIGWLTDLVTFITKIANGDMTASIAKSSDKDQVYEWLVLLKNNINGLAAETALLAKAAADGKLATRADGSKHQGDYRKIVEGVNQTLDAVIGPLNVSAEYVDRISKGDIPPKITETYKGDFNEIKNNLNNCIDAVSQLVTETGLLIKASAEGKLATRADATKHQGDYRKIVEGVNAMLDAILLPIGEGNRVLGLVRGGNLREKIEIVCHGDHEKMKNSINGVHDWLTALIAYVTKIANGDMTAAIAKASEQDQIHEWLVLLKNNVNALVADTVMLAKAAVDGKLGTRADASKHEGAYRKIVEGVNGILEAIIEPLKITAQSASSLASSAEELTSVSHQMAGNAEETATQANVVSAASEQVSRNVATVASGGEQMQSSIREIAKNANEAARVAKNAVSVAHTTNETVAKLGDSSTEIGNVIKVITSIAQQTNLLALNATIEAARAGEAGKGFAVVANEVKELAKQTAKATEEISQKIEAIQGDTKASVQAIGEISGIINQINDISNSIASAVEEQTVTTNEINRSMAEAAKGVGDITKNITGVAVAAKDTTQGANNSQKAAQELSQMASRLQQVVSRFTF